MRCGWEPFVPLVLSPTLGCPCGLPPSADGALDEVSHQTDLVAVELQRNRTFHSQFARHLTRRPSSRLPGHRPLDGGRRASAATAFTAILMRSMRSRESVIADAT